MLPVKQDLFVAVIFISLLVTIMGLVVVSAVISYKKKQDAYLHQLKLMKEDYDKQLMWSQIEMQEEAFAHLGQELHDDIGQLLSSTKLLINVTQRSMKEIPDTLQIAEETLSTAIQHLRALSKSFSRQWLDQFSLIENLKAEVERINSSRAIQVKFTHELTVLPLQAEPQIILFRIIQEAMQNCIKHARPQVIDISIRTADQQLILLIADDGSGFDKTGMSSIGMGIREPLIARWPGKIPAGKTSELPSVQYDIMATFADIAGIKAPANDGISLLPEMTGKHKQQAGRKYIYFEYPEKGGAVAIRMGNWKAIKNGLKKNPDAAWELYDLATDKSEERDVASAHQDLLPTFDAIVKKEHRNAHINEWEFLHSKMKATK
jgi:two-component sensor histidine kinase